MVSPAHRVQLPGGEDGRQEGERQVVVHPSLQEDRQVLISTRSSSKAADITQCVFSVSDLIDMKLFQCLKYNWLYLKYRASNKRVLPFWILDMFRLGSMRRLDLLFDLTRLSKNLQRGKI